MSDKIGCDEKIQIGMGAFEMCGNDYYGEPIYCERCKLLIDIQKMPDKYLDQIGMHRSKDGNVYSNALGNTDSLKSLGVKSNER